jgi:hypothetical protein
VDRPPVSYTSLGHTRSTQKLGTAYPLNRALLLVYKHMQSYLSLKKVAYSTMLGCFKPFNSEISLIAVLGTPSSSFSSLIFLSATIYIFHVNVRMTSHYTI